MTRKLFILLSMLICLTMVPNSVVASTDIIIDATNFPDDNFRNFLLSQPYGSDEKLTTEEIASITTIQVGNKGIYDLKGIEFFTALTNLNCSYNKLTSLDVSKNTSLSQLTCYRNSLTALDVTKNTALFYLGCGENNLTSLDVGNNTDLRTLYCYRNKLTSLDVSTNTKLRDLNCKYNQLFTLDLSSNTSLEQLECLANNLTSLVLPNNNKLTYIVCYLNKIKGERMDALIASLPTVVSGKLKVISNSSDEANICTTLQVTTAKAKGWTVYQYNTQSQTDDEYSGSVPENTSTGITIDATNFPDETFRNYLLSQDYGSDGKLTKTEIAGITRMSVRMKGIKDLTGIEYFTALTFLDCIYNSLTSLDLWNNTELDTLICFDNKLTSLNITKNKKLRTLRCDSNKLTSLDVSNNANLTELSCYDNSFTILDLSHNKMLDNLTCSKTKLSTLDVSKNTKLTKLFCHSNNWTTLDVSKNVALEVLECSSNNLTSLDVSKNTKLESLDCSFNSLTTLDLSKNPALRLLKIQRNNFTALDLSKNTALKTLWCYRNSIKDEKMDALIASLPNVASGHFEVISDYADEGNVCTTIQVNNVNAKGWKAYLYMEGGYYTLYYGSQPEVVGIAIDATNFPDEAFRNYLLNQPYGSDAMLTEEEIASISQIDVSNCGIKSLKGIEYFTALTDLSCPYNQLSSLDVSKNTELAVLNCTENKLIKLEVSNLTKLKHLYCSGNRFTSLDVSKNTLLTELFCAGNDLSTLDVSKNTLLYYLYCHLNKLTSLDLSKNKQLKELKISVNNISGANMDALIESLPTVEGGRLYAIDTRDEMEANVCTKQQVAMAKQKGWTVYNGNAVYGGSDDGPQVGTIFTAQTVEGVTMTFKVTSVEPMMCQVGNGIDAAISTAQTGVVTIPAEANGCKVTSIGSNAFKGCKMKECVIPETVTKVCSGAFGNNVNLEAITAQCTTPFDFDEDAFDDAIYAVTIMNVPQTAFQTFQAAAVGQTFANVQATPQAGSGNYVVGTLFNEPVWKDHLMTCKVTSTEHCQVGNGNKASVFAGSAKSIKLPEQARSLTLNVIGRRAFYNCAKLESVFITEKIEEIGEEAFYGCSRLQTLDLPRSVKRVAKDAFNNSGLSGGSSGGGSSSGGSGVRYHAGQGHLIPPGVNYEQLPPTEEDYEATREIHITAHMTKLAEHGMFSYCHNIIRMYVDEGNEVYDSRGDCNAIIRTADNMLLYGCQKTVIPKNVTAINTCAFEGHDGLTLIKIPAKVKSIGRRAFAGCVELDRVYSYIRNPEPFNDDTFSSESYENGTLYVPFGKKVIYQTTNGWKNFKHIVEMNPPQDVITFSDPLVKDICVENWDTDDDGELTETEAKEVTRLDLHFYGKDITSFDELKYFTSLKNLADKEFYGCYNLSSLTLPDGLVSIGERAIDASSLSKIVIPKSVSSVATLTSHAFARNNNLLSLSVEEGNSTYDSRDNCNAIIFTQTNQLVIGTKRTNIPSTVHGISSYAFKGVQHLEHITLPDNIKLIEACAYAECVDIEQVTSFIEAPFAIHDNTFEASVYQTATLRVPNGTKELYANTDGWRNFLHIEEMNATIVATDEGSEEQGTGAIVEINDDGETGTLIDGKGILDWWYIISARIAPLLDWTIISELLINAIGNYAFENNENIHRVSIPETIEYIGDGAFRNCTGLEAIYVHSREPMILFGANSSSSAKGIVRRADGTPVECSVFEGVDKELCVLYVPRGCTEAYRNAYGWGEFLHIEEFDAEDGIRSIESEGENKVIYNLAGQRLTKLQRGVNIVSGRKVVVK